MTTVAPRPEDVLTLEGVEEQTAQAWAAYRDGLRELSGPEYDQAENTGWEQLQEQLSRLDRRRVELSGMDGERAGS